MMEKKSSSSCLTVKVVITVEEKIIMVVFLLLRGTVFVLCFVVVPCAGGRFRRTKHERGWRVDCASFFQKKLVRFSTSRGNSSLSYCPPFFPINFLTGNISNTFGVVGCA
jgi:hypothetical protein